MWTLYSFEFDVCAWQISDGAVSKQKYGSPN